MYTNCFWVRAYTPNLMQLSISKFSQSATRASPVYDRVVVGLRSHTTWLQPAIVSRCTIFWEAENFKMI